MSGKGQPWYKREPQRFLDGVVLLDPFEVAVYAVVLDLIYAQGGETLNHPRSIAARMEGLTESKCKRVLENLISKGKLVEFDGKLTNNKARLMLELVDIVREKRAEAGAIGGKKSSKNKGRGKANASGDRGADKKREEIEERKKLIQKSFDEWWTQYPRKVARKTCLLSYVRCFNEHGPEVIMLGTMRHADAWAEKCTAVKFIPLPITFLNQERFLDDTSDTVPPETTGPGGNGARQLYSDLERDEDD